jgi:hypothetical protein
MLCVGSWRWLLVPTAGDGPPARNPDIASRCRRPDPASLKTRPACDDRRASAVARRVPLDRMHHTSRTAGAIATHPVPMARPPAPDRYRTINPRRSAKCSERLGLGPVRAQFLARGEPRRGDRELNRSTKLSNDTDAVQEGRQIRWAACDGDARQVPAQGAVTDNDQRRVMTCSSGRSCTTTSDVRRT